MKKYILTSFLVLILFSSCKEKSVIDKELDFLEVDTNDYTKIDTSFYESESIKSLRFYKNENDYLEVSFYESGEKESFHFIQNDQIQGESIYWFENGNHKSVDHYNQGNQIGIRTEFFENGNPKRKYNQDSLEYIEYWENGKTKFKFIQGKSQSYHYLNGNYMEKYDHITKDRPSIELFSENGDLVFSGSSDVNDELVYKNDSLFTGKIICYFNNGKISHYEDLVDGRRLGKYYGYYGNGNLKFEGEEGVFYKYYYENGKLQILGDNESNTITQYDEEGNITSSSPLERKE